MIHSKFIFAILLCEVFLVSCASHKVQNYETVYVQSKESLTWSRGCFLGDGGNGSFVTYLPLNSTCEDHNEMLSIHSNDFDLPIMKSSLNTYFEKRKIYGTNNSCLNFRIIQEDQYSLMWEQSPLKCTDEKKQYTITKLFLGKENIHMVEYSHVYKLLTKTDKTLWLEDIKKSYVEKNGFRVQIQ